MKRAFLLVFALTTLILGQSYDNQKQCGKIVHKTIPSALTSNAAQTFEGQWPWHVALYKARDKDNNYICGGTLVSDLHVITAAHCVYNMLSNKPVDKNSLSVHLGKHKLKYSFEGTRHRIVEEIKIHPEYNSVTSNHNLAILKLREPVAYTDWVQPVCLWPDDQIDLSNVIGKTGSVVGWGLDDSNQFSEELKLVEIPVIDQETCIKSFPEFFTKFTSDRTYCAGNTNGTSLCLGTGGGGMVFNNHDIWYLRGIVSLAVRSKEDFRCDSRYYVVFTDLAKFLPWIRGIVNES